jgi:hypothetical protein
MSDPEPTHCTRCGTKVMSGVVGYEAICPQCDKKERWNTFSQDHILHSKLIMDALMSEQLCKQRDYQAENEYVIDQSLIRQVLAAETIITAAVKEFEKQVWFAEPSLQKVVKACQTHGMKYEDPSAPTFFLAYDMCGRTMMTIENETASLTLITETDSKKRYMGFEGISATLEQAITLLAWAIVNRSKIVAEIKPAPNVSMF